MRMSKSRTDNEDITSLPRALTNVGEDEDAHIDADILVSLVGPTNVRGDAADEMEHDTAIQSSGRAKAQTHDMVCQWVAQSRDAKELTKEEATSLAMLATEHAAVYTVETHTLTCPIPQRGAVGLREEFCVVLTAKRANGECWNLSQEADQQGFVALQQ